MSTVSIPLTQGKVAIIDEEDDGKVSGYKWYAHVTRRKGVDLWYAWAKVPKDANGKRRTILMHRLLTDFQYPMVDHTNGDGLDNRRENIRPCTPSQNQMNRINLTNNTSGYRGVVWRKDTQMWRAKIGKDGRHIYVGHFANPVDAARAYDDAARELFGEFARLNFPEG
jgi:hypothetical protein